MKTLTKDQLKEIQEKRTKQFKAMLGLLFCVTIAPFLIFIAATSFATVLMVLK